MSGGGQRLELIVDGNGNAVGSGEWLGGRGVLFVWRSVGSTFDCQLEVSADGGVNWIRIKTIAVGGGPAFGKACFVSLPAMKVRVDGDGTADPAGFHAILLGHDDVEPTLFQQHTL